MYISNSSKKLNENQLLLFPLCPFTCGPTCNAHIRGKCAILKDTDFPKKDYEKDLCPFHKPAEAAG